MREMSFPAPMQATSGGRPFSSSEWLYQIKFDGFRCLAGTADSRVELRTKTGTSCSAWWPEVCTELGVLKGDHVIDGEAAVLDSIGRSDFNAMLKRSARRRWYEGCDRVTYCAFDLLVHDGKPIMNLPLEERLERLAHVLRRVRGVLCLGELPAQAELFSQVVLPLKLEGVVAKKRDSEYRPGERSSDWLKIKRPNWQEGRTWVGTRRSGAPRGKQARPGEA